MQFFSKEELRSMLHTFIAVLVPIVLINLQTLDVTNLSKESLIAFGVAVIRSLVKALSNKYFPVA